MASNAADAKLIAEITKKVLAAVSETIDAKFAILERKLTDINDEQPEANTQQLALITKQVRVVVNDHTKQVIVPLIAKTAGELRDYVNFTTSDGTEDLHDFRMLATGRNDNANAITDGGVDNMPKFAFNDDD